MNVIDGETEKIGPEAWARTALTAARQAVRVSAQVDRAVKGFVSSSFRASTDAERQLGALAALVEKGERARELARRVAETLAGLGARDRLVLRMKFLDRATPAELAEALGVTKRTVFRRIHSAVATFSGRFVSAGYFADAQCFLADGWISGICSESSNRFF